MKPNFWAMFICTQIGCGTNSSPPEENYLDIAGMRHTATSMKVGQSLICADGCRYEFRGIQSANWPRQYVFYDPHGLLITIDVYDTAFMRRLVACKAKVE